MAEKVGTRTRTLDAMRWRDGIVIGLAQAVALIPGVSRAGATMSAGLFLGLERAAAARYSFLLSIPAVILSGISELRHIGGEGGAGVGPTALATVIAFAVGYASIALLLRFLTTNTVLIFVIYRVALGTVVLVLVATGSISRDRLDGRHRAYLWGAPEMAVRPRRRQDFRPSGPCSAYWASNALRSHRAATSRLSGRAEQATLGVQADVSFPQTNPRPPDRATAAGVRTTRLRGCIGELSVGISLVTERTSFAPISGERHDDSR